MKGIRIPATGEVYTLSNDFTFEDMEGLIEALEHDGEEYEILPDDKPDPVRPKEPNRFFATEGRERRKARPSADQIRAQQAAEANKAHAAHEAEITARKKEHDLPAWAVRLQEDLELTIAAGKDADVTTYGDTEVCWVDSLGRWQQSTRSAGNGAIAEKIAQALGVAVERKPARPRLY